VVSEFKTNVFFYKLLSLRALAALSACPQKREGESAGGGVEGILHSVFSEREASKGRATRVERRCREVREKAKTEAEITCHDRGGRDTMTM